MRIGIDFDNTIVCYGDIFFHAAVQRRLISHGAIQSREAIRDYLNGSGRADDFTRLQGYVYGPGLEKATLWPGVTEFIASARQHGHFVAVVSHKSARPLTGPPYDLRRDALKFLVRNGLIDDELLPLDAVHFEDSQCAKAAKITSLGLDVFVDDLPEFLSRSDLPIDMMRLYFNPHERNSQSTNLRDFRCWAEISDWLPESARSE